MRFHAVRSTFVERTKTRKRARLQGTINFVYHTPLPSPARVSKETHLGSIRLRSGGTEAN
jgi:hypothetical protein